MAFLTVANITVEMVSFRRRKPEYRGESVRAFDQTLLTGIDRPKRGWEGATYPLTPAQVGQLEAATANGAHVACSGTALRGASVTCRVDIDTADYGPDISAGAEDWTGHNEVLSLVLTEV